jgi:hypothetical protein
VGTLLGGLAGSVGVGDSGTGAQAAAKNATAKANSAHMTARLFISGFS